MKKWIKLICLMLTLCVFTVGCAPAAQPEQQKNPEQNPEAEGGSIGAVPECWSRR